MQVFWRTESFNGNDISILIHNCQRQAGIDTSAIDDNGTRATLPVITSFFRSRQLQIFT